MKLETGNSKLVVRAALAAGALLLASSYFLPPGFDRTPVEQTKWMFHAGMQDDNPVSRFGFVCASLIVVYPYLWALILAITSLLGPAKDSIAKWIHLACHCAGGALIHELGILLLSVKGEFPPVWVQWTAALAPVVFLALVLLAAFKVREARRVHAVVILGLFPMVPVEFILAFEVAHYNGPAWGFVLGGIGATLAFASAVALFASAPREAAVQTHDSSQTIR